MLANLRDAEDLSSIQPPVAPPVRPSLPRLNEHQLGRTDEGISASVTNMIHFSPLQTAHVCDCVAVEALTFPPSSGKSFIMGSDEALESELGLGELAGLTVANEAENLSYDVSIGLLSLTKSKTSVFTQISDTLCSFRYESV